ncbi:MAG: hypothetical protein WB562_05465 [Candidatus Sulfotelmatobacter sp.]
MKATLEVINRMQAEGVIAHYAIGGAVGATFYLEPAATLDVDIFVILPYEPEGSLVSLGRIYEYLQARGYKAQDEHIVIEGWPVQFLVPATELEKQAVVGALPERLEDITIWVMSETDLVLIALQTGRRKDHLRILQFLEQGIVDLKMLKILIERYGLAAKWQAFKHRYLEGRNE